MAAFFPVEEYKTISDGGIIEHFSDKRYAIPIHGSHHAFSSDFPERARRYHEEGLTWSESEMMDYFRSGLLSFYIADLLGVPCIDEFERFKPYVLGEKSQDFSPVASKREFESLYEEADCHLAKVDKIRFMHVIHALAKKISLNPQLLHSGACYLQLRRMQEELDKDSPEDQDALDVMIQIPIAERGIQLQGLAYNIINWFRGQIVTHIKSHLATGKPIEEVVDVFKPNKLPGELAERAADSPDYASLSVEKYREEFSAFLIDDEGPSNPRI